MNKVQVLSTNAITSDIWMFSLLMHWKEFWAYFAAELLRKLKIVILNCHCLIREIHNNDGRKLISIWCILNSHFSQPYVMTMRIGWLTYQTMKNLASRTRNHMKQKLKLKLIPTRKLEHFPIQEQKGVSRVNKNNFFS